MAPIADTPDTNLLHLTRISQYVPLPPTSLHAALPAISAEVFSPLLLTYYPPAKGVILAYEDVSLSSKPPRIHVPSTTKSRRRARDGAGQEEAEEEVEVEPEVEEERKEGIVLSLCTDEYVAPYLWASATLLVWRPELDFYISATLTHQSATHVTLAHLNTFAVTVLKEHLPMGWEWHATAAGRKKKGFDGRIADEGGVWVDGEGVQVEKGREMNVRVREWDVRGGKGKGVLRVDGSLLSVEEERARAEKRAGKKARGVVGGEGMEVD